MEPSYAIIPEFKIYNRYQELERREREKKELAWEKELLLAMNASDPLGTGCTPSDNQEVLHTCRSCPKLNSHNPKLNSKLKKPKSCENESFNPSWDLKTDDITVKDSNSHVKESTSQNSKNIRVTSSKKDDEQNLLSLCVSCSRSRVNREKHSDIKTCDIDTKLQQLDFIDRTPSPVDKNVDLNGKN